MSSSLILQYWVNRSHRRFNKEINFERGVAASGFRFGDRYRESPEFTSWITSVPSNRAERPIKEIRGRFMYRDAIVAVITLVGNIILRSGYLVLVNGIVSVSILQQRTEGSFGSSRVGWRVPTVEGLSEHFVRRRGSAYVWGSLEGQELWRTYDFSV